MYHLTALKPSYMPLSEMLAFGNARRRYSYTPYFATRLERSPQADQLVLSHNVKR